MLTISGEKNRYRSFQRRDKISALSFSYNFSKYCDKRNVLFVKINFISEKNTYMWQLFCCVNNKNKKRDKNWQLRNESTGESEVMREAKAKPMLHWYCPSSLGIYVRSELDNDPRSVKLFLKHCYTPWFPPSPVQMLLTIYTTGQYIHIDSNICYAIFLFNIFTFILPADMYFISSELIWLNANHYLSTLSDLLLRFT